MMKTRTQPRTWNFPTATPAAALGASLGLGMLAATPAAGESVARMWNDELLGAIRADTARPTVHARNLFHVSGAMYDAWSVYDPTADGYLVDERQTTPDPTAARQEAISYAAYRVLNHRFVDSPGGPVALPRFDALMNRLGYDPSTTTTTGDSAAAVGNRIGQAYIDFGLGDGSNEINDYVDTSGYSTSNPPLVVATPGITMDDPDRWQPLTIQVDGGEQTQRFLTPHWGDVTTFAVIKPEDGSPIGSDRVGPPPAFGTEEFRRDALEVLRFSSTLDPEAGPGSQVVDISPGTTGNNPPGTSDGVGRAINPVTGQPYETNEVRLGNWGRVLAEFWADGPDSETPPGHWNVIANEVSDSPLLERRIGGVGAVVDELEWDAKLYFALNAAAHDSAVTAWDLKRRVDYVRPISMIRYMAELGQSSDPSLANYHPQGLPLEPGLVEVVTAETAAVGGRHEGLAVGTLAVFAWRGHDAAPEDETNAGVGWIDGRTWVPYQAEDFVTPPFSGYISGHSTFSRAMAEVLTGITGSEFFPGGSGEFFFEESRGLNFEDGPSEDVLLQWATYTDAADEAGLSRIYGGIHVRADDFDGRLLGRDIGRDAFQRASSYFDGTARVIPTPAALPAGLLLLTTLLLRRR